MASNPRNLVDNYNVGQSTDSALPDNSYDNESVDSDYSNAPFIVDGELEPCIIEDSNNDNMPIHVAPYPFECSENFDILDGIKLNEVLDGIPNEVMNIDELCVEAVDEREDEEEKKGRVKHSIADGYIKENKAVYISRFGNRRGTLWCCSDFCGNI